MDDASVGPGLGREVEAGWFGQTIAVHHDSELCGELEEQKGLVLMTLCDSRARG